MINYLNNLGLLNNLELQMLEGVLQVRSVRKGAFLIQEGVVCNEMYFLKSGMLRSFYIDTKGNDVTNCIAFANEFMGAFTSFITGQPTEENIQAIQDAEVMVLTRQALERLYQESAAFQKVGRILTEGQYVVLAQRIASFQKQTAKERYDVLVRERSDYLKYIPLQYLASYLGISSRHLSRLRKGL